jgi:hypothetical protein
MVELTVKLVLFLGTIPGLFPQWRDTAIAAGAYMVVLFAGFLWALNESGGMTNIEGPAFVGIFLFWGLIEFSLGLSCVGKLTATAIAKKLSKAARSKLLKIALLAFFSSIFLFFALKICGRSDLSRFIEFLCILLLPFLWISLAMWLLPENFKHGKKKSLA